MEVSELLNAAAGAAAVLGAAEIVAGVGFMALCGWKSPRLGILIAVLGVAAAALIVSLATETQICTDTCYASASFGTKVYVLWTVATVLAFALAVAPWRQTRTAPGTISELAPQDPPTAAGSSGAYGGAWGPSRLLAVAGALVAVGAVVVLMWLDSGANGCAVCSTYQDVMAVSGGAVIVAFPAAVMMLLVLAVVRGLRHRF